MGVGGNCLFTAVAIAGFAWQYAWIFLLLDVLLISDDLQNLLKAVIIPWRQLVLALYSLLVFTAILSVVNFFLNVYDDDGDDDASGVYQPHIGVQNSQKFTGRAQRGRVTDGGLLRSLIVVGEAFNVGPHSTLALVHRRLVLPAPFPSRSSCDPDLRRSSMRLDVDRPFTRCFPRGVHVT